MARYPGAALAVALIVAAALIVRAGEGAAQETRLPAAAIIPGVAADAGVLGCGTELPAGCILPTATLAVHGNDGRGVALTVELASTPEARQRGLMFRESLPEYAGMLFVFQHEWTGGFWMKNTPLPLDIAYLADDGTVLEIVHGVPFSLALLSPAQSYRYTLEVNGGWFARHGFGPGDRVELPAGPAVR